MLPETCQYNRSQWSVAGAPRTPLQTWRWPLNPGVSQYENGRRVDPNSVINMTGGSGDYHEVIDTPIGGVRFLNTSEKVPRSGIVDAVLSALRADDTRTNPHPDRYYT